MSSASCVGRLAWGSGSSPRSCRFPSRPTDHSIAADESFPSPYCSVHEQRSFIISDSMSFYHLSSSPTSCTSTCGHSRRPRGPADSTHISACGRPSDVQFATPHELLGTSSSRGTIGASVGRRCALFPCRPFRITTMIVSEVCAGGCACRKRHWLDGLARPVKPWCTSGSRGSGRRHRYCGRASRL